MNIQQEFQKNIISTSAEKRRRQIISIIALAGLIAGFLTLLTIPIFADPDDTLLETLRYPAVTQIFFGTMLGMFFCGLSLLLSKRMVMLSGILIVLGILITILMSDDFFQIASGRSTIYLALPILAAAIAIRPSATFAASGLLTLFLMNPPGGLMYVNVYTISAIWLLALCVWLTTSIMEKAIVTAQMETQRVRAMLGVVSHELRTPLGSINGYSDLLAMSGEMSTLQSEMLGRIKSSSSALTVMVNRILDTAYIQSGKLALKPVQISTQEFFSPVREAIEKQTSAKGLKFQFQIEDMPRHILIDPVRFQQIISNLLDNAVKYTGSGTVEMRVKGENNKMRVVIRDTGIGIPRDSLGAVFHEFVQVEHFTTRDHGGVGLGLFIVQNLVNLMDGSITVESEIGRGTTFSLTLPLHSVK